MTIMHYLSVLILVVITNLSISAAYSERYQGDHRNTKYEMPTYGAPEDEVINIGNGVNRKNVVILDTSRADRSQPDPLGYRFGADPTHNNNDEKSSWQRSSTTNIGNGYNNRNIVTINSGRRTDHTNSLDSSDGGMTYVHNKHNGLDVFNVGYGKNNQNKVTVEGRPIEPDCYGNTCDDLKVYRRKNGAARTNQVLSSLFFCFSLFHLIL